MHAYDKDGNPCHTVPTVSKGAKSKTRPTGLKDIIKNGWYPSVTGVCDVMSKDALTRWHCNNVAEAAVKAGPGADHLAVVREYFDAPGEAAQIGDGIHKALEAHYTGGELPEFLQLYDGHCYPTIQIIGPAIELLSKHRIEVLKSEFVTVNKEYGYAGTVDMRVRLGNKMLGIGDFKSKKTAAGKQIAPSETHPCQIAAYYVPEVGPLVENIQGDLSEMCGGFNLYISSTEPGRCEIKFWTMAELHASWEAFKCMLALWKWRNNYYPGAK